jgi:hypothetical protein
LGKGQTVQAHLVVQVPLSMAVEEALEVKTQAIVMVNLALQVDCLAAVQQARIMLLPLLRV